jgi:uncharacterized damage-inducible protein DinB
MEKRSEPPSPLSLRAHLERQMRVAFRHLRRAIEGLSEAQAREGARDDWRRYRWGVGLDGSIAGIVWHVAAWKQIFAQGLETGVFPAEEEVAPPGTNWSTLREWLTEGQARIERAFEPLSETALAETREWEGEMAPVTQFLIYVIDHDIYHTGQIELLRQLRGYPNVED